MSAAMVFIEGSTEKVLKAKKLTRRFFLTLKVNILNDFPLNK